MWRAVRKTIRRCSWEKTWKFRTALVDGVKHFTGAERDGPEIQRRLRPLQRLAQSSRGAEWPSERAPFPLLYAAGYVYFYSAF